MKVVLEDKGAGWNFAMLFAMPFTDGTARENAIGVYIKATISIHLKL